MGPVNTYTNTHVRPVVYNKVVPVVKPVVKYVDAHHTEGMTAEGVPEKTDSVKIAEKQHELAKTIEESKAKVAYVAPYTTYGGVTYPYVHNVAHVVAKREADSEAEPEPYVTYNGVYGTVYGGVNPLVNTYATAYNTYNYAPYRYNYAPYAYTNGYYY